MGVWGNGPFDNDDAADLLMGLCDASDLSVIRSALRLRWFDYLYLQAPKGSVIVAAAEVLTAGLKSGPDDLPPEVQYWIKFNSNLPYQALAAIARRRVRQVRGMQSELRYLWKANTGEWNRWNKRMQSLSQRLST